MLIIKLNAEEEKQKNCVQMANHTPNLNYN